ncbi:MAG: Asp-tRNA(Asn)/Glu-tRNA(Gln) amidotransferase subunit GatA [Planctomycetes bacterium]|nr:Asp-tRNA(Asn)/Glu-tRNA(Gln) amidotransferase subunit GatA [Planctomycetota bacterium]
MSLINLTATELLGQMQSGQATSVDITRAFIERIKQVDGRVGALLRYDADSALAQAEAVDRKRRAKQPLGPLAGLPIAVKDLICSTGELTTCASKILKDFRAPYDATVIMRLKGADAVLLGRTNLDEFAMGGSTENSGFQPTRNPWDLSRSPGGSSGGSAAAVAASLAPLSLGTDTGGSIRQPAAFCGITGLKPGYGRVSRFGLVAFASSLDQIGPMAWTVEDAALLLGVIAGHDPRDSTSVNQPVPDYLAALRRPLDGLTLGLVREHFAAGLDGEIESAVREAIRLYESLGAKVKEVSLPHSKYGVAAYYLVAPCEASSNLARYDGIHYGHRADEKAIQAEFEADRKQLVAAGKHEAAERLDMPLVRLYRRSREEGFGPEVKRRIMLGTYALSAGYYDAYYLKALKVRRLIQQDYLDAFKQCELLIGPVTTTPAIKLGENANNPLAMYLLDLYTVTANLAGVAGISIPCGFTKAGLPIGLQLQGAAFAEDRLLHAAQQYQAKTDWHQKRPALASG